MPNPSGTQREIGLNLEVWRQLLLQRSVDTVRGCRIWMGHVHDDGYGRVRYRVKRKASWIRAHRLAYLCWRGAIADGLHVLHSCDTPLCINPSHLWLGTNGDNIQDGIRKGRIRHDERGRWASAS